MDKILISLPQELIQRLRSIVAPRQRSQFVRDLLIKELEKREKKLRRCAAEVEKDQALNREMKDWDLTLDDGMNDETW